MDKPRELTVFITSTSATCDECGEELGKRAWITLSEKRKAFCLSCADLDHLVFLPAGDTALTRRSKKHSALWAVVVKWSRARKRYERQGLLVEEDALTRAEEECAADEQQRTAARERARERRAEIDAEHVESFARALQREFPGCPGERAELIARHACRRSSGRVGRSAAARSLDPHAVVLAVAAHVRHHETDYDILLMSGTDRRDARREVQSEVDAVLDRWRRARS